MLLGWKREKRSLEGQGRSGGGGGVEVFGLKLHNLPYLTCKIPVT